MATTGCERCGQCGCNCSVLPLAAIVTFSGLENQTRAAQCSVEFYSCFGSGVSAMVTSPGGCPPYTEPYCGTFCPPQNTATGIEYPNDSGPVESVLLVSGGECYARVGRDDPTGHVFVRAVPEGDAPPTAIVLRPAAAFVPENTDTSAPIRVSQVSVVDDSQGMASLWLTGPDADAFLLEGYDLKLRANIGLDFEVKQYYQVTVNAQDEDIEGSEPVSATFQLVLVDSITEAGNTKLVPETANPPSPPPPVTQPGPEEAVFVPVFERVVDDSCYGSLESPCWPSDTEIPETPYWKIVDMEVSGGRWYRGQEPLTFRVSPGVVQVRPAIGYVEVDDAGVPTGVKMLQEGEFYLENRDPDASIVSPVIGCVRCSVAENVYYLPDGRTVTYPYAVPTNTNAVIVGVVENDPANPRFGQVIELTIQEAGENAIGWRWARSCAYLLNDKPIMVYSSSSPLVSFELDSCFGRGACILAHPAPDRFEPELRILGRGTCHAVFADEVTPRYGCGGTITYETEQTFENDDPTRPIWSVVSVSASGGENYDDLANAYVFLHDPITSRPDYKCPLHGNLPVITLHATDGVLTGATLVSGGGFYLERPYAGEPVPIKRVEVVSGGGSHQRRVRGQPLMSAYAVDNPGRGYEFIVSEMEQIGDVWVIRSVAWQPTEGAEFDFVPYVEGVIRASPVMGTTGEDAEMWLFVWETGEPKEVRVIRPGRYWQEVVEEVETGYAILGRVAPTLEAVPGPGVVGSGASVSLAVASKLDECNRDYWYVESAEVSGGTGYRNGEKLRVVGSQGDTAAVPARLSLIVGKDGVPDGIEVVDAGQYWRESVDAPAYVTDYTVLTIQDAPSNGSGVELEITIDSDPESETFGTVTKAKVTNEGKNYTLAGPGGCGYVALDCDIDVNITAARTDVTLANGDASGRLRGNSVAPDCSEWETQANVVTGLNSGVSVSVSAPAEQMASCDGTPVCYDRCPDLRLLCITVTFQTPLGNVVKHSQDFTWVGSAGRIVSGSVGGGITIEDSDLFIGAQLSVSCSNGELSFSAGWNGFVAEDCFCTGAEGCASAQCDDGNWWEGQYLIQLSYGQAIDNPEDPCADCPDPGTVLVQITTPEEIGPGC